MRIDSLARALGRAEAQSVRVVRLGPGLYLVPSVSRPGEGYQVDVRIPGAETCQCKGWRHAGCCKHVAAAMRVEYAGRTEGVA